MTREEFKANLENKLLLLNEAKKLFPMIFEVLKKYDGKNIGEKTKSKINQELKEKCGCEWNYHNGRYLYFVHWNRNESNLLDFVFRKNDAVFGTNGKLNLGNFDDYVIASPYDKLNEKNLDDVINKIEEHYNKLISAFDIIESEAKILRTYLYADIGTFNLRCWCIDSLFENYIIQNSLFER